MSRPPPKGWVSSGCAHGLAGAQRVLERTEDAVGNALRTTRFLRGKLAFQARHDDVYVVTYPRSGTTWVQFILHLLRSENAPLDFEHLSQVSPWWERSLALGSRQAEDFETALAPRIFKSHLPRRWLPGAGRFVYVVRDGLDVAVSYHHLYRSHLGYQEDFSAFFERFLSGRLQYGSWVKHVEGWRCFDDRPNVLFLRYETMRGDLRGTLRQLADFTGWSLSPSRETELLELASFDYMKAHEERFDPITETLLDQGLRRGRFIRTGRTGSGAERVTAEMRSRFEALLEQPMRRPDLETRLPDFLH